jgi:hypothetical protein
LPPDLKEESSRFFEKKRRKKLLLIWAMGCGGADAHGQLKRALQQGIMPVRRR